jgi:predicted negative regulator of RcsB-dependent stress response
MTTEQKNFMERNAGITGAVGVILIIGAMAGLFIFRGEASAQFERIDSVNTTQSQELEKQSQRIERLEAMNNKLDRILHAVEKK